MTKKIYVQIFLLSVIVFSLIWFYDKYFLKKEDQNNKIELNENKDIKDLKSNLIYNLNYKSTDLDNNIYIISSKSGEMSQNGSEFLMNVVNAKIVLSDKSEIIITADNALYNNNNYNTEFYGNVVSKYGFQTIFSGKMKLDFDINKIKIYEEVKPTLVDLVDFTMSLHEAELQNGDILCFQLDPSDDGHDAGAGGIVEVAEKRKAQTSSQKSLSQHDPKGNHYHITLELLNV